MGKMRSAAWMCAALLGLLDSHSAWAVDVSPAVEVDPVGSGQVLLLPLWTTTGGHATLLNIQNVEETNSGRHIAKLRVLDPQGGVAFSGSLYFMGEHDSWVAGIGARPGGGSRLASNDQTCLLLEGEAGVEPFSGIADIDADYGSLEVIVMGSRWEQTPHMQMYPYTVWNWDQICQELADRWNEDAWDQVTYPPRMHPMYQLRGEWSIVHVERGTLFQVPGVAIDGYSDRVQHTRPGDPLPDLASGHGAQTDEGVTASRICADGLCRIDTWPTPLDALAAALMVDHFRGSYNISPGAGAATDLVVNYPLRKYYAERDGDEHPLSTAWLSMTYRNRDGTARNEPVCFGFPGPCWDTVMEIEGESGSAIIPVTFNRIWAEAAVVSALLELPGSAPINNEISSSDPLANEGVFFGRPVGTPLNHPTGALISNEGNHFFAAPVIPVVFQQFENGVLPAGDGTMQRANYGTAIAPSTWPWPIGWEDVGDP